MTRRELLALAAAPLLPVVQEGEVRRTRLPNGARLLHQPEAGTGLVSLCLTIRAGLMEEGILPGIGLLVARGLLLGGLNFSAKRAIQIAESVGGNLEVRFGIDMTTLQCTTSRDGFPDAIYLLGQAVQSATFEQEPLAQAKMMVEADRRVDAADRYTQAYAAVRQALAGETAYRRSLTGGSSNLNRLDTRHALAYVERWFTPDRLVVGILGDVTAAEADAAALRNFGRLERAEVKSASNPVPRRQEPSKLIRKLTSPGPSLLAMGFAGPARHDPKYPEFVLLGALLGGGKACRLFDAIRTQRNLAYVSAAQVEPCRLESHLMLYSIFEGDEAGKTADQIEAVTAEVAKHAADKGFTQGELDRAVNFVIGQRLIRRERREHWIDSLVRAEQIAGGYRSEIAQDDRLRGVTLAQVNSLAQRSLASGATVRVGPESRTS